MAQSDGRDKPDPLARIYAILDENRAMAIATLRPDGWPQATMVGYARDDALNLYFVVAEDSQKLANVRNDARVSLALGQQGPNHLRGLSLAGVAEVVSDGAEVERLNDLIADRYPEEILFSPRETSSVMLRVSPHIISVIDHGKDPGRPALFELAAGRLVRLG